MQASALFQNVKFAFYLSAEARPAANGINLHLRRVRLCDESASHHELALFRNYRVAAGGLPFTQACRLQSVDPTPPPRLRRPKRCA
jgi:hypothetical protein